MKALILDAEHQTASTQELNDVPTPGPNELLVQVKAIALNPVDALYTFRPLGSTGRVVGSDFAGLVVARGPAAAPRSDSTASMSSSVDGGGSAVYPRRNSVAVNGLGGLNRGDRVAGFLQGACSVNERPGAFAEYVVCAADLVWRIPGSVTFEEAAGVSLCGLTAAQGLFFRLGLEAPFQWDDGEEGLLRRVESQSSQGEVEDEEQIRPFSFFVYGASTSVGMYAVQLVRRSAEATGRTVRLIGAASKVHWPILKAEPFGYDHLVDYRDTDWPEKVWNASGGGVDFAYDGISEGSTVKQVSTTLKQGGKMAVVRSREAGAWQGEDIPTKPMYGAVWEGLGADVEYHNLVVRTSPSKRAFASAFYKWLSDGGKLHPNPVRLMPGGLERVVADGFALLGTGVSDRKHQRPEDHMRPISGEKLVYTIESVHRRGSVGG